MICLVCPLGGRRCFLGLSVFRNVNREGDYVTELNAEKACTEVEGGFVWLFGMGRGRDWVFHWKLS